MALLGGVLGEPSHCNLESFITLLSWPLERANDLKRMDWRKFPALWKYQLMDIVYKIYIL